jgi:hypothetical protein
VAYMRKVVETLSKQRHGRKLYFFGDGAVHSGWPWCFSHSGLLKRSRFPLGDKAFLFLHSAGFRGLEKGNTLCGGTLYFA